MTIDLRYSVHVTPMHPLDPGGGITVPGGATATWSPLSSTLVFGPTEALLVDPPITRAQGNAVAKWAAEFGRTVTTIYVTHAHGDHWYATPTILETFPDARVVTTEGVLAQMRGLNPDGHRAPFWDAIFPHLIDDSPILATPVPADGLAVDGQPVAPIPMGHSDMADSTVLHVPSIDLVVAGDVIYNRVHQYLAESADGGLESWLRAVDRVAALAPATVVAGHKDPRRGDDPSIIDDTRRYLLAAAEVFAAAPTRREYFDAMVGRFARWLNPTIAWLSALRRLSG